MAEYIKKKHVLDMIAINYAISANDCCRILCDALFHAVKEEPTIEVEEEEPVPLRIGGAVRFEIDKGEDDG